MVTTDIAEWLVLKGVPFREANTVAGLVQEALALVPNCQSCSFT